MPACQGSTVRKTFFDPKLHLAGLQTTMHCALLRGSLAKVMQSPWLHVCQSTCLLQVSTAASEKVHLTISPPACQGHATRLSTMLVLHHMSDARWRCLQVREVRLKPSRERMLQADLLLTNLAAQRQLMKRCCCGNSSCSQPGRIAGICKLRRALQFTQGAKRSPQNKPCKRRDEQALVVKQRWL